MSASRRAAQFGLLIAGLILVVSMGVLIAGQNAHPSRTGRPAPDFQLQDIDGRTVSFSDYRDNVVVLIFTSYRCPFSGVFRQRVARLADRYAGQVSFLAVDSYVPADDHVALTEIRTQGRAVGRNYPVLLDPAGEVARGFGAKVTPTIYVMRGGRIYYEGAFDDNEDESQVQHRYCEDAVAALLEMRPPPTDFTQAIGCKLRPR